MSRHQDRNKGGKASGRGSNNSRGKSQARGNAPIKKAAPQSSRAATSTSGKGGIRLNKYIANSGICSRREADMYISTGQVSVNGEIINEMGYKVNLDDDVRFDGRRINPEPKAYVLLNKPKGFSVTTSNSKGMTVMDLVAPATKSRIQPVGRLGRNATGLILFTNDDKIMQKLTNSKAGMPRLFHIELDKNLKAEDLEKIKKGLTVQGKKYEVEDLSYVEGAPKKEVGLKIRNIGSGIIRTIFEHLEYQVVRVDCVTLGPLTKKDLPRGKYKHLNQQEINNLMML
ncbi:MULTISPECIES: pseudouridine synthase [unclassified Leeuwenhoekiella]|uniref:pseudouridine synthase n=1 Tax=unclassified Leeuwenhoekiella TaxID=2615029 RepID=UPI000C6AF9C5|nr:MULTISPECIES: pseudouridine synthase [unclassified Leeuwenhoekiella]MBA80485.1 pseudouridylate synthase [Leeuwenhoekiella sp.]|tara:strand:- start:75100 stop:75954 length:855 start_codon:yes stop_codon:yes gene_type:complete